MNNSLLHVGIQISRNDFDNFYCKVLGFVQDRSFELTDDNALKIFQTEKGASVLVGCIPELPLELFVSEDGDLYPVKDKVIKWQLPIEMDGLSGECYVQFPDDLLEAANLKEGDPVEWIDRGDGSFELRKVNGTK